MSETRFRFPSLRSAVSVDSAVGSQHSSTDDDNKSSEDNDEASQDSVSTDEVRAFGSLKIKLLSVKLIYLVEFNIKHYLLHINVRRMRVPRTPAS